MAVCCARAQDFGFPYLAENIWSGDKIEPPIAGPESYDCM